METPNESSSGGLAGDEDWGAAMVEQAAVRGAVEPEIGRASCRERV